jgi:hypothetical protein
LQELLEAVLVQQLGLVVLRLEDLPLAQQA